jgi:hypothetical protein
MLMCASLPFARQTLAQSKTDDSRQSQPAGAGPVSIDGITVTHGIMVTDEIVATDGIIATDCSPMPNGAEPGNYQKSLSALHQ